MWIGCIFGCNDYFGLLSFLLLLWSSGTATWMLLASSSHGVSGADRIATHVTSPRSRAAVSMGSPISWTVTTRHSDQRQPPLLRNTSVFRVDCRRKTPPSLGHQQRDGCITAPIHHEEQNPQDRDPPAQHVSLPPRGPMLPVADWVRGAPGCTQLHAHPCNFPLFTGADYRQFTEKASTLRHDPCSPAPPC